MEQTGKKVISAATGTLLALGALGSAVAMPAQQALAEDAATVTEDTQATAQQSDIVRESEVRGTLTATQAKTLTANVLKKIFRNAPAVLCAAGLHEEQALPDNVPGDAMAWKFTVSGNVKNSYEAAVGDLVGDDGAQTKVIGCACMGNPADGRAIANAEVTGIKLSSIITAAGPRADANAVIFTSADGYSQTIPLWYVYAHSCVLAYEVAGEPVSESMGGTVQLWLHGASANYYVSDVVSIELATLDEAPADPSDSSQFINSPNVTVLEAA